jgi:small GTP-binding protein
MDDENNYDLIVKVVLLGETSVGKTNLLFRYTLDKFKTDVKATIGLDFVSEEKKIDGRNIKAQFWDTAGQEKYKTIARSYYKIADGILLVYDVTRRETFLKIQDWINDIKENCSKSIPIMLVGNKTDLVEERTVSKEEGKECAKTFNCFFYETSAKLNDEKCVNQAFEILLKQCVNNIYDQIKKEDEIRYEDVRKNTTNIKYKPEKKGCC